MPSCIVDKFKGEVFAVGVKTLIHLGATKKRMYMDDIKNIKNLDKGKEKNFLMLGRPSLPAIFAN